MIEADFLLHQGRFHLWLAPKARAFLSTGIASTPCYAGLVHDGGTHRQVLQIDCRIHVAVVKHATGWTRPLAHCQRQGFQRVLLRAKYLRLEPRKVVAATPARRALVRQEPSFALPSAQGLRLHAERFGGFMDRDELPSSLSDLRFDGALR
jgi:hypothetical protein